MLSIDSYNVLALFPDQSAVIPAPKMPVDVTADRLRLLVDSGLLLIVPLCPPGKEPEHPNGLYGYQLSAAGYDVRCEYANAARQKEEDAAKVERDKRNAKRHDLFIALIGAVASSFLTLFIEHFDKIIVFFIKLFSR